jgi:hypothetical protein
MNFCINCQHYKSREEYKSTRHFCRRDQAANYNLVTGEPISGYLKDAEVERAGDSSAGYCGEVGMYFVRKVLKDINSGLQKQ